MMLRSAILAYLPYALATAFSPGLNNVLFICSVSRHGWKKSRYVLLGIASGFLCMMILCALFCYQLAKRVPQAAEYMEYIGAVYILWLAWNILHSSHDEQLRHREHCNFYTGLFVQLTNAKIIVFCAAALTTYALPYAHSYLDVLKIALLLPLFGGPIANLLWLFAGAGLQRFFQKYQKET